MIPDLTRDPRTAANPLVTGEPFIRFYAGAPCAPRAVWRSAACASSTRNRARRG